MKASELRIGNYYNQFENTEKVSWSTLKTLEESTTEQLWCKPIPLTDEWLLKFGFEKADEIYFIEFGVYSMTIKEYEKGKYILNPETHFNYVDIEYVHQLQNLYFALTNEELTYEQQK